MSFVKQADGSGQVEIGGTKWPVSYQVVAEDEKDGSKNVHLELSVPRDWLIERGFRSEARLIRENGAEIDIRSPDVISTGDPVAIRLRSDATKIGSEKEAFERFPELTH